MLFGEERTVSEGERSDASEMEEEKERDSDKKGRSHCHLSCNGIKTCTQTISLCLLRLSR